MKKFAAMALALIMCLSFAACGDSSSDSKDGGAKETKAAAETKADEENTGDESKDDAEPETTTEAEPAEPLNENVVHADFSNTVLNLTASFDIANIDGFETQERTQTPDDYRAMGGYGYPDPEWYSSAITVDYVYRVISPEHVEELNNKENDYQNYEKTDLGSAYDTYMKKDESYNCKYDLIFVGGDYLDGKYVLELTVMTQLDSGKPEDVDLIIDTFAKSLKLDADESVLKTADGFSLANGVTSANKATVAGQDVDMVQSIYMNDNCISAKTSFVADDIGYDFFTYLVDDNFGGSDYADCTIAGKPGKIKLALGVGNLTVDADVQLDDGKVLHMSIDSDSALTQGELSDAAKLAEAFEEMLNDDNKEATQEKFAGYFSDIVSAFTFS